jgi:hypothetical protein
MPEAPGIRASEPVGWAAETVSESLAVLLLSESQPLTAR